MPTFNGGDLNHFRDWVQQNVIYPEIAIENGIQGKVYIQFTRTFGLVFILHRKRLAKLIENAEMKFAILTETGERYPIGSELFVSEALNAGESRKTEGVV